MPNTVNIGTGSLPNYLNFWDSAKELSIEVNTATKGNFLDISKDAEFIFENILVENSIADVIILTPEQT